MTELDHSNNDAAHVPSDVKLTLTVIVAVVALLAIWIAAIAQFGFGAFIYVLHAAVLAAFVFTLTLTRP